ncbi:hypothetical protein FRC12_004716 [Ceratobasidium sp. 428]|nr:hypothetical protein FRC12_004716 [Ceratobasidium sp. 428]
MNTGQGLNDTESGRNQSVSGATQENPVVENLTDVGLVFPNIQTPPTTEGGFNSSNLVAGGHLQLGPALVDAPAPGLAINPAFDPVADPGPVFPVQGDEAPLEENETALGEEDDGEDEGFPLAKGFRGIPGVSFGSH